MSSGLILKEFQHKFQRNIKLKCEICSEQFGVFKKEHICKRCLSSVCQNCSISKVKTYRADRIIKLHRMCKRCEVQYNKIQKYVDANNLKFGEDSQIILMWLKQLGYKSLPKGPIKKKSYFQFISIQRIWTSLNFSFRQFIGTIIEKSATTDETIIDYAAWGIQQLKKIKQYEPQKTFYLYLFFLCHGRPQTAIIFTLQILKILKGKTIQLEQIVQLLQEQHFSQMEIYKVQNLLEEELIVIQSQASVNIFPITVSIDIINFLFTYKNIEPFVKSIAYIFLECKSSLTIASTKSEDIFIDILKKGSSINVRSSLKQFQFSLSQNLDNSRKESEIQKELEILKKKYFEQEQKIKDLEKTYESQKNEERLNNSMNLLNSNGLDMSDYAHEDYRQSYLSTNVDNVQSYQSLLHAKNQELDTLRMKLSLKQAESEKTEAQLRRSFEQYKEQLMKAKLELKQKDKTIKKYIDENQSLKNMNNLLLLKLNELSGLLMDQQEEQIKQSEERLQSMKKQILDMDPKMKQQCCIY